MPKKPVSVVLLVTKKESPMFRSKHRDSSSNYLITLNKDGHELSGEFGNIVDCRV